MAKKKIPVIKKHSLMPNHTKISEGDKKKLLEKYHIDLQDLPKIRKDDAALQSMSVKEGDVVKITRDSPTSGESIFYRVVIGG